MATRKTNPDFLNGVPELLLLELLSQRPMYGYELVQELQSTGFSDSQAMTEASHRLGDSRKLAKKTVSEYRRRHWCGRWPLLTFMLAPIPAYIAAYAATGFSVIFIVYSMTKIGL